MFELAPFDLPPGYADEIVPLADVKAWVAVEADETEFDDLLSAMRDAGVDMVERYCGVFLAPREGVVWTADSLPTVLRLGVGPVTAVSQVTYLDTAGTPQVIDVETLRIGLHGELLPIPGQQWPASVGAGLQVTFDAGFETPPAGLVTAVKMFAAHLFKNREAVIESGSAAGEVPLGFKAQCASYKRMVL